MSSITLESSSLSYSALFSLLIRGHLVIWVLFCTGCGIAGFLGYNTITINSQHLHGITALIGGIVLGPIFALVFGILNWLFVSLGLWLYTRVKPICLK